MDSATFACVSANISTKRKRVRFGAKNTLACASCLYGEESGAVDLRRAGNGRIEFLHTVGEGLGFSFAPVPSLKVRIRGAQNQMGGKWFRESAHQGPNGKRPWTFRRQAAKDGDVKRRPIK